MSFKRLFIYRLVFLFALLFSINQLEAQNWSLIMEMMVKEDGKKLSGAEIQVFRDGKLVEKVLTDVKGRADIPMKPNGLYNIVITGNGMIAKKLSVDTRNIPPETIKDAVIYPAEVEIFKKMEGLDYSILQKPIGKIVFDPAYGDFTADPDYTKEMKAALQKLQDDYLDQKEKEALQIKQNEKLYADAIKLADKAFAAEDWENAEIEYKKAEKLNPTEPYPSFQLAELQTKLIKIRENNAKYDQAIKAAEAALASKNYPSALDDFKKAASYKPNEAYPKTKITEIQGILASEAKLEQNYLASIEKGDNALKANDLNGAKAAFEEATKIKPAESYPKNKLAEIGDILNKQNAKEAEYAAAIKLGDETLAQKDYANSKKAYEKAAALKPGETYPKAQITKLEGLLADAAKQEQEYLLAIQKGDQALAANQHQEALTAFQSATGIKPTEAYPKQKIAEINQLIANNAAKDKQYQDLIKTADQNLAKKDLTAAKTSYTEASKIKPNETYPKQKIAEIDGLLAASAELDKNYQAAISSGDAAMAKKDFEAAKAAYTKALGLKAEEKYPQDKLTEIGTILVGMQKQEEEYNKAVADGDKAFGSNDFEAAKTAYLKAASLKPTATYPPEKLAAIDKKLAELNEKENAYKTAIASGDEAMKTESYEKAEAAYMKALSFKPAETYPQSQLSLIDEKKAALAKAAAEAAKIEADYQAALKAGDEALLANTYEPAKAAYEKALSLKPGEKYPQTKLAEIADRIANSNKIEDDYKKAIASGDALFKDNDLKNAAAEYLKALSLKPAEKYPQEQVSKIDQTLLELKRAEAEAEKLEENYQAAISKGVSSFNDRNYEDALTAFTQALGFKPDEKFPATKIEDIKKIQETLAKQKEEGERLKLLQAQFDEFIKKGDAAYAKEDLATAKTEYQAATALLPDEAYPKIKLDEINAKLSDVAAKEEAYQTAIKEADALLAKSDFENAKAKYTSASSIKPSETYPKDKLAEIQAKLDQLAKEQEEIRLKNQASAELDKKFNDAVSEGDAAMKAEDYDKAEAAYMKALSFKPSEIYPQSQLGIIDEKREAKRLAEELAAKAAGQAEIDKNYQAAIAEADAAMKTENFDAAENGYNKALTIKPTESYPPAQLSLINEKREAKRLAEELAAKAAGQAELDKNYQAAIAEGDAAMQTENYDAAEKGYMKALSFKPAETYPQSQLGIIDEKREAKRLADEQKKNAAEQAAIDAKYQGLIAQADQLAQSEQFLEAITAYKSAQVVKPAETYPQEQVDMLNKRMAALNNEKEEAARKAKLEMDYLAMIEKADQQLAANQLKEARASFVQAQQIKSEEAYPKTKIQEIDALLAKELEKNAAKAAQLEQEYQAAIQAADAAMAAADYTTAKGKYTEAKNLKPAEAYPSSKLQEIEDLLKNAQAREEEIRLSKEREARNEAAYQTAVVEGDNAFDAEDLSLAKSKYQLALDLKPSEEYPAKKIRQIEAILNKKAAAEQEAERKRMEAANLDKYYNQAIKDGDGNFANAALSAAKINYEKAVSLKPNEIYPKDQLRKIDAALESQRLAAQAERAKLDEPIKIQTGPTATITGDAEAEIDRIYREKWGKKNSDKNSLLEDRRKELKEMEEEDIKEDQEDIQNAIQKIEEMVEAVDNIGEGIDEINLQNHQTIVEKTEGLMETEKALISQSEEYRNNNRSNEEGLAEDLMNFNKTRNEEIIDGKKEAVENRLEEMETIIKEEYADHDARIQENQEKTFQKKTDVLEFDRERAADILENSKDLPATELADWEATQGEYQVGINTRTDKEFVRIVEKREEQGGLVKQLSEQQGLNDKQQKINEKVMEEYQFNKEHLDDYKPNQEAIVKKTEELKEEEESLMSEAENKRLENANREFYDGEELPRQDRMAEKYPQGVSEEIIENQNNSTTIRRIVVKGTQADVYEKTLYSWGEIFYTKNGANTTKETWDSESK